MAGRNGSIDGLVSLYCPLCQDELGVLTEVRAAVSGICARAVWIQCPQCDEEWTVTPELAAAHPSPGVHGRSVIRLAVRS